MVSATLCAQEKRFDSIVDPGLPKEVKYLDEQKRQAFAREKPKLDIVSKLNKSNTYRMGNILIKANAVSNERIENKEKPSGVPLEEWKRSSDRSNVEYPNPDYSSEIRKIGNGKILIMHFGELEGVYQYFIAGDNLSYDKRFVITIDYEKKDAVKAKKLVEHILKNVKFK